MRGDDGEGCFCVLMISSLSTLKKEKIKSVRVFCGTILVNFIWRRVVFAVVPKGHHKELLGEGNFLPKNSRMLLYCNDHGELIVCLYLME